MAEELRFVNISATELGCEKEVVERCIKSCLGLVESCDFPTDTTLWLLGSRDNVLSNWIKLQDGRKVTFGALHGILSEIRCNFAEVNDGCDFNISTIIYNKRDILV